MFFYIFRAKTIREFDYIRDFIIDSLRDPDWYDTQYQKVIFNIM